MLYSTQKLLILSCIALYVPLSIAAATTSTVSIPQQPSMNLTFNIQTSASAPTSNTSTVTTSQQASQSQTMRSEMWQYLQSLHDAAQAKLATMPALYAYIQNMVSEHKFLLCATAALLTYSAIFIRILRDNYYIKQPTLWVHWKSTSTLAELCTQPHEPLCKELIIAIQSRYINNGNPTDFVTPLCAFLHDLNNEERRLKRFYAYTYYLSKIKLHKVLPFSTTTITHVATMLDRIAFIRHLFVSWASNYNWQQTTP